MDDMVHATYQLFFVDLKYPCSVLNINARALYWTNEATETV